MVGYGHQPGGPVPAIEDARKRQEGFQKDDARAQEGRMARMVFYCKPT
jgi:hypothetical protein